MKPYYECHITMSVPNSSDRLLSGYLENLTGWRFSQIDGDPVLGYGVKCYLTKHYPASTNTSHTIAESDRIAGLMGKIVDKVRNAGLEVIRQKIELVVYDTKTNSEIRS